MRIIFDCCLSIFFFKQKTAYEMRISDWSSDVCSSDLTTSCGSCPTRPRPPSGVATTPTWIRFDDAYPHPPPACPCPRHGQDRKSVVEGKSVSVRVDLGGRRIIKKKIQYTEHSYTMRQ